VTRRDPSSSIAKAVAHGRVVHGGERRRGSSLSRSPLWAGTEMLSFKPAAVDPVRFVNVPRDRN